MSNELISTLRQLFREEGMRPTGLGWDIAELRFEDGPPPRGNGLAWKPFGYAMVTRSDGEVISFVCWRRPAQ